MRFKTISSPHTLQTHSVGRLMRHVLYALVPGTLAATWYFGWGVLINVVLAGILALAFEAGMLALRQRPLRPALTDNSALLTAWLLALAIPPLSPWWLTATGVFFAIVVAKQLYGGLGYNPFNPAMVGYVVLLISFPAMMTQWPPPSMLAEVQFNPLEALGIILSGKLPGNLQWDALTMATPLDTVKTELGLNRTLSEIRANPLFGDFSGKGWEWIGNWFALGGIYLAVRRFIDWRIPVAMLTSLAVIATLFSLYDPDSYTSAPFQIFSGGTLLGAFFIATDPVTASATPRGRLIYGAGIGVLTYIIRWGGYPDGVAFAVLLMNLAAPMIDYYTRPRVFGRSHGGDSSP